MLVRSLSPSPSFFALSALLFLLGGGPLGGCISPLLLDLLREWVLDRLPSLSSIRPLVSSSKTLSFTPTSALQTLVVALLFSPRLCPSLLDGAVGGRGMRSETELPAL